MTFIYFVLILGITVLFHEFGHYIVAKWSGVYVYEFSIGMGPRIFKWKSKNGETEYSLRILPIGGFVSLAGEEEEENKDIPKGRSLRDIRLLKKVLITIAGVFNNFLLAIFLLFIVGLFAGYTNPKPIIESVEENTSAYNAGIQSNDKIVGLNGHFVNNYDKLILELQTIKSEDIVLTIERENKKQDVNVTAVKEEVDGNVTYHIGFLLKQDTEHGFFAAVKYAFAKFASLVEQMVFILVYLFGGRIALNSLSGPVGIYMLVGTVAKTGFINIIYLMAYLSLNVGIINILPVPAFDGGRLFIYFIEKIRGKKLSQKTENMINGVGLILLMLLMAYVTFNDIFKII